MKVFVTGGAGFIGSHLVDRLMQEKNEVTVFDNLSSGRIEFIEHHLGRDNFRLVQADLLDMGKVKKAMKGHDIVFHLAANPDARLGIEDTELDLKQETIVTYNVIEAMRINKIKKIVFSSSGTIYGETPVIPLVEDYGPVLPISLYGAGKLASEGLISAFCHTFGMRAWIFRFANIVGERETHGVIYDFINKLKKNPHKLEILGDGTQKKPYLHVKDCVEGVIFGLQNSNGRINVFNLGCSSSTDVTTIANMVIKKMDLKNVECRYTGGDRGWPGDVPQVRFNTEKMVNLGWRARYTSDEAVELAANSLVEELVDEDMQVVILAGGLATRLRPLTNNVPKSMIMVDGKPFLQYQLEFLKKKGIYDIVLCVGYLSEQIETYFGDGSQFGVNIRYSKECGRLLGTAGALKNAEKYLKDMFFVMYGDSYLFLDFGEIMSYFKGLNKLALMTVYENYDKYDESNVVIEGGLVKKYDKKHKTKDMIHIDYGVSILKKEVLDMVTENEVYSLEDLFTVLIKQNELLAFKTKKRFYEIGSHRSLGEFKNYVLRGMAR